MPLEVYGSVYRDLNGTYFQTQLVPSRFEQCQSHPKSAQHAIYLTKTSPHLHYPVSPNKYPYIWIFARIDTSQPIHIYIRPMTLSDMDYFSSFPPGFSWLPIATFDDKIPIFNCPPFPQKSAKEEEESKSGSLVGDKQLEITRSLLRKVKTRESKPFITDLSRLLLLEDVKSIAKKPIILRKRRKEEKGKDKGKGGKVGLPMNDENGWGVVIPPEVIKEFWVNGAVCLKQVFCPALFSFPFSRKYSHRYSTKNCLKN